MPQANKTTQLSKITKHTSLLFLATLLSNLGAYGLQYLGIRILAPHQLGYFNLAWQLISLLAIPALGIQLFIAKHYAENLSPKVSTPAPALTSLIANLAYWLLIILILASYPLSRLFNLQLTTYAIIVGISLGTILTHTFLGYFQGSEQFKKMAILTIVLGGIKILPTSLLLTQGINPSLLSYLIALLVLIIIFNSQVTTALQISSYLKAFPTTLKIPLTKLTLILSGLNIQAISLIYLGLDLILAGKILSATQLGYYAAGNFLTKIAFWLPQALAMVWFPQMIKKPLTRQILWKIVAGITSLLIGGSLLVATLGNTLINLTLGNKYQILAGMAWKFLLYGAILALLQLTLIYAYSQNHTKISLVPWLLLGIQTLAISILAHQLTTIINLSLLIAGSGTYLLIFTLLFTSPTTQSKHRSSNS